MCFVAKKNNMNVDLVIFSCFVGYLKNKMKLKENILKIGFVNIFYSLVAPTLVNQRWLKMIEKKNGS